jgi:prepilin-type N-terminal cleavage/methylation domain-containing protein
VPRPRGTRSRLGFTLLELIAASVVLAAAGVMTAQVVVWSRAAARVADEERLAWQEASNCLELLTAEGYEAVTPRRAAECRLSDVASAGISAGQLVVTVTALDEPLPSKRITAEVAWELGDAQTQRTVRLTTVLYAPRRDGKDS